MAEATAVYTQTGHQQTGSVPCEALTEALKGEIWRNDFHSVDASTLLSFIGWGKKKGEGFNHGELCQFQ